MSRESDKITNTIEQGLADTSIDLLQDFTELGFDTLLDNPALKEIPIVKSLVGLIKGGLAIREIHFAKKLLTFLKTFHRGGLLEENRLVFIDKLKFDKEYRDAVVEHIAVLNDRFIHEKKSIVLANLLRAHVNNNLGWGEFTYLAEILDGLPVKAFKGLEKISLAYPKGLIFSNGPLHSEYVDGPVLLGAGVVTYANSFHYYVNYTGMLLYRYGILGDLDYVHENPDTSPPKYTVSAT